MYLQVTDSAFNTLQPKVEAAERDGAAFASQDTRSTPPPEGMLGSAVCTRKPTVGIGL